jgi:G3E family GTPase
LKGDHGKRIVVIENEFGEIDIDSELVVFQDDAEENLLLLNNGCMCCTVRGDLVDMLGKLVTDKKGQFDHILIETTGLANPAPIIQTFYLEPDLLDTLRLDGVVTLVDSKYTMMHLDEVKPEGVVNEALEQVAFADRIVMNKTDLVTEAELRSMEARVRTINNLATIQRAEHAVVDLDFVLGIGGFDLDRVQDVIEPPKAEHSHGHGEEKCEEPECDDPSHSHSHGEEKCEDAKCDDPSHSHSHGDAAAAEAECDVCGDHGHSHSHHVHDDAVTSVSLVMDGEVDLDKVNDWLGMLLNDRWQDLFRMKGVLAIEGCDDRYVFQGVHALFEGMPDRPWNDGEARTSRLVFIGKELDRAELEAGFQACKVGAAAGAAGASA